MEDLGIPILLGREDELPIEQGIAEGLSTKADGLDTRFHRTVDQERILPEGSSHFFGGCIAWETVPEEDPDEKNAQQKAYKIKFQPFLETWVS